MDIRLSLERPYKNDEGLPIPVLQDITQEGELIYEPKVTPSQLLSENLRRVFTERGTDFFERNSNGFLEKRVLTAEKSNDDRHSDDSSEITDDDDDQLTVKPMTTEELFKMKTEVLPSLYIALGEMQHASMLLSTILSTPTPSVLSQIPIHPAATQEAPPPATLATTTVSKPPQIGSVQAFNAQLVIGGKDEALRKAAGLFRTATERMEKGRIRNERYWVDALKIRRANWGLVPAPLPFGSGLGRGADKTSKDFVISYGLEESPQTFRRNAIAYMAHGDESADNLVFPHRLNTRLRISLANVATDGPRMYTHNSVSQNKDGSSLDETLKCAKREIIEQEIFALIAQEAGTFPTASARVSERLIVIEAAQGTELKFELLDADLISDSSSAADLLHQAKCDLIYHYLFALLLRRHSFQKSQRHGTAPNPKDITRTTPTLLRPIIDLIQYQVFCERIKSELDAVTTSLSVAGIKSVLRFQPVGETGKELIKIPIDDSDRGIGGESILRIDNRHTVRLTMLSPSSLTAHLPQARIVISSIPQLEELLADEVERFFLQRICEIGRQLCDPSGGIWFVDLNRCVGRWEGCVVNFRIVYGEKFSISCSASRLDRKNPKTPVIETYEASQMKTPILSWVHGVISTALAEQ
ncbi:hypothetical protein K435DRAFT_13103 [Dendrothele bispora CBS 962.96]|uniref:Mediator of RNA polymerase II transcription subunit 17 n=1 Tax=Dendrothele bispora (strain CBS 962.96) TaxID=1314807 RepID=A0A4S8MYH1_DENBC|nr:hypothetical protein K435DRAFT_13103 [Dendrothele bispora CBS 962.96]